VISDNVFWLVGNGHSGKTVLWIDDRFNRVDFDTSRRTLRLDRDLLENFKIAYDSKECIGEELVAWKICELICKSCEEMGYSLGCIGFDDAEEAVFKENLRRREDILLWVDNEWANAKKHKDYYGLYWAWCCFGVESFFGRLKHNRLYFVTQWPGNQLKKFDGSEGTHPYALASQEVKDLLKVRCIYFSGVPAGIASDLRATLKSHSVTYDRERGFLGACLWGIDSYNWWFEDKNPGLTRVRHNFSDMDSNGLKEINDWLGRILPACTIVSNSKRKSSKNGFNYSFGLHEVLKTLVGAYARAHGDIHPVGNGMRSKIPCVAVIALLTLSVIRNERDRIRLWESLGDQWNAVDRLATVLPNTTSSENVRKLLNVLASLGDREDAALLKVLSNNKFDTGVCNIESITLGRNSISLSIDPKTFSLRNLANNSGDANVQIRTFGETCKALSSEIKMQTHFESNVLEFSTAVQNSAELDRLLL